MIRKGEPWERPAAGPPECRVEGDDAALAAAVRDRPGVRVGFRPAPSSDLARAVGLHDAGLPDAGLPEPGDAPYELALDALRVDADGRDLYAVNMVVVGTPPDRTRWSSRAEPLRVVVDGRAVHDGPATTVVVASGQFLRGHDVVPRGHPGDGRAEVQVYALARGQRSALRRRLALGTHLPHPDVAQTAGRQVEVEATGGRTGRRALAVELDGVAVAPAERVVVEVVPGAFLVVV